MTRPVRIVVGLLVTTLWLSAVSRLATTPAWADLGHVLVQDVRPRPGVWRLVRGTLHHLALPALGLVATLLAGVAWRRDRRAALLFVAGVVATNVVVQAMKRGPLPAPEGLNPLSGHVGVAAGIGLCWFAALSGGPGSALPRAARGPVAAVVSGGVAVGVLLTGWHDVPEVLGPLGVATGTAIAVAQPVAGHRPRVFGWTAVLGAGALAALLVTWSASWGAGASDDPLAAGVLSAALALAGTACAVALVALCERTSRPPAGTTAAAHSPPDVRVSQRQSLG
ncbi:hypothetical protein ACOCJ4_03810 [Knoellia sp. CPCC 206435]|uniref:hypothetical protein n=1 Tax=Knoellia terrae TaxID=3404797 RepID=UPI003B42FD40